MAKQNINFVKIIEKQKLCQLTPIYVYETTNNKTFDAKDYARSEYGKVRPLVDLPTYVYEEKNGKLVKTKEINSRAGLHILKAIDNERMKVVIGGLQDEDRLELDVTREFIYKYLVYFYTLNDNLVIKLIGNKYEFYDEKTGEIRFHVETSKVTQKMEKQGMSNVGTDIESIINAIAEYGGKIIRLPKEDKYNAKDPIKLDDRLVTTIVEFAEPKLEYTLSGASTTTPNKVTSKMNVNLKFKKYIEVATKDPNKKIEGFLYTDKNIFREGKKELSEIYAIIPGEVTLKNSIGKYQILEKPNDRVLAQLTKISNINFKTSTVYRINLIGVPLVAKHTVPSNVLSPTDFQKLLKEYMHTKSDKTKESTSKPREINYNIYCPGASEEFIISSLATAGLEIGYSGQGDIKQVSLLSSSHSTTESKGVSEKPTTIEFAIDSEEMTQSSGLSNMTIDEAKYILSKTIVDILGYETDEKFKDFNTDVAQSGEVISIERNSKLARTEYTKVNLINGGCYYVRFINGDGEIK